jgi:hypothetical protein
MVATENTVIDQQVCMYTEVSKSLGVRLKESDIAALNQRFRLDGFKT